MLINTKLHEKSRSYLLLCYMKKASQKVKAEKIHKVKAFHLCHNFALTLHEICPRFSQSDARNFSCILLMTLLADILLATITDRNFPNWNWTMKSNLCGVL